MTHIIPIALALLSSPAHAEGWCNGMLTSNNACIGSESNVPPVIIRCDYYSSNTDPRCVGVGRADQPIDRPRPKKSTTSR
jgi:hypothetical protein